MKAIKEIKEVEDTNLYIEGQEYFKQDVLDYIEEMVDMKISNGEDTKIKYLPMIMKDIFKSMKDSLEEKEVLVICDDKEKSKKIIKGISKDAVFITAIGCNKDEQEEIYDYILEEVGLSLFYPSNINRVLENYSLIINFTDNIKYDFSRTRRNCVFFDFGFGNNIGNRKKFPIIKDIGFSLKDLGLNETKWLDKVVKASVREALEEKNGQSKVYLYIDNDYYLIKDYINLFIKVKGHF